MNNENILDNYLKAFTIADMRTSVIEMYLTDLEKKWDEASYNYLFAELAKRYTHDIKQIAENIRIRKLQAECLNKQQHSAAEAKQLITSMLLIKNLHGNHINHLRESYDISNKLIGILMKHSGFETLNSEFS